MPQIGEIKRGQAIGLKRSVKFIWIACPDCDKERWIAYCTTQRQKDVGICHTCSSRKNSPLPPSGKGPLSPHWKGGVKHEGGYVKIYAPEHHRATKKSYVLEHILIWEQVHGKPLPKGWEVHHLNGIGSDNRPCNLIAMPSRRHRLILGAKAKRIRELEAEVKLLEKALDESQIIFRFEEN